MARHLHTSESNVVAEKLEAMDAQLQELNTLLKVLSAQQAAQLGHLRKIANETQVANFR